MLARCARVAPARMRAGPASAYLICSFLSVCSTDTPLVSNRLSEPLAPLMVTASAAMVAVTPWGSSTGALAILDMMAALWVGALLSGDDAQDFTALSDRARLLVGHHTLGRGDDHRAHAVQDFRQLVLAAVNPQARAADALQAVDDGPAFEILQANREPRLVAVGIEAEVGNVALILQHLDDGGLQARGRELHFALARGLAVADARQQIGNGVGHAHAAPLTSSPWRDRESRRGWRPRGSSPSRGRTCGTRRASGR